MDRKEAEKKLTEEVENWLAPLGFLCVALEIAQQGKLRVFIEKSDRSAGSIGIDDCVQATRAIDEPLDRSEAAERIFKGTYELEVSSPGLDRPLRTDSDYERFSGTLARVHTFRPMEADEIGNHDYLNRNPKQKNFLGVLKGLEDSKVLLEIETQAVSIPLKLISKANLEPVFDTGPGSTI